MKEDDEHNKYAYRTESYWNLPENVRNAIDVAQMKAKHSDFYYRLQTLNDKILVFRSIFYNKMPHYQKVFLEKKRKELEEKLAKQKELFEQEMKAIELKTLKKFKSSNNVIAAASFLN